MFRLLLGLLQRSFYSRRDLLLENLSLRQQLLALQRRRPRPRPAPLDRLFWVVTRHRAVLGRKPVSGELRDLIFRMVAENPTWGAPRIHGELLKLGFDISERTVSRWVQRAPKSPEPAQRWKAFLHNHREAIAAMDFFTIPTLTFSVLSCFFVMAHDRRRILHCNVTRHPSGFWIAQQLARDFSL